MSVELELASWRRAVAGLYEQIRDCADPADGQLLWRTGRDELFRSHPQSPLPADDPLRASGLPFWPYDPALRFTCEVIPSDPVELAIPTASDGTIRMRRIGVVHLPEPIGSTLDVWWLDQYAGGLFVPLRDATAGTETYGGGRYLLDSAKGADLGGVDDAIVIDLNFAYHPSCRYNPRWECPLAPEGNRVDAAVRAGERLG
jgi:uncharacterized protein (DUF1684 family)